MGREGSNEGNRKSIIVIMDSLLIKKLFAIQSVQDTLLNHTVKLQQVIETIKSESIWLKLLPFFGVILGAVMAYCGQFFLKRQDINVINRKEKREAVNKIFKNLTLLEFYLRELAYLEVDSKYQYQIYCKEDGDGKKRALEEHYNDYKYIADNRAKIAAALSELQTSFATYYQIEKELVSDDCTKLLDQLSTHIIGLKRHSDYDEKLDLTTEMLEQDISTLKDEYSRNIKSVTDFAKTLEI